MKRNILLLLLFLSFFQTLPAQPKPEHNFFFKTLPTRWDAGLPLGNGMLGCLIWQNGTKLRLSLDRADLWDLRPMKGLHRPEFSYRWVAEQVGKGQYDVVQEYFDRPYEREAGPTKLPGTALEFDIQGLGKVIKVELDISTGTASVEWSSGVAFTAFVHAEKQEGWYRWTPKSGKRPGIPKLIQPNYGGSNAGNDIARLGYVQGTEAGNNGVTVYHQPCGNGFYYDVALMESSGAGFISGTWSISGHFSNRKNQEPAEKTVRKAINRGFDPSLAESKKWWAGFWSKSSVSLPDTLLERQYYRDLYKFGCAARENTPMINLQSVWTADNGHLPPWKSDFHHDLNTQLSYWPAYTSNHLDLAEGYLNHLERNDAAHRRYTNRFFGTSGLNVPGVETLDGEPMGGWIQYALSPTVSAWLAQHFYLQWRYTQDRTFLRSRAWPFMHDVAVHLEELTHKTQEGGFRTLPLSSSPEINDNSINAWFPNTWTNYDLALARFVFEKTAELADELNKPEEGKKWRTVLSELPAYATGPGGELKFAPGLEYRESHRHFSHLMAIHPLGLLDWNRESDRRLIGSSLHRLDSVGSDAWTGYSFTWLACLRARARDGNGARNALRIFAEAFVSPNSFHLNGDQSGKGYSKNTGDPFTLEGNFAFAAGVQEMLLQSQGGTMRVFPAVPGDWKDASFTNLCAEGAFLVSAEMHGGQARRIEVFSEKGGDLSIELPAGKWVLEQKNGGLASGGWRGKIRRGEQVVFLNEEN